MKTKIFVMTHKKFSEPTEPGYIPLHVGRALGQDLGYLGDDTGHHISDLNPSYGELTGIYWLWKNYSDVDYVGVCHYRRYFWNARNQLMTIPEYERILQEYDVIVSNGVYGDVILDAYATAHNVNDLLACGEAIKTLYPEDSAYFDQVINQNKSYFGNLCVMSKKMFDDYCTWLFAIFEEAGKKIDTTGYVAYHARVFGFLSETLLMVYVYARKLRIYECQVGLTAEKAETVEFRNRLAELVAQGAFDEAKAYFYDYQKDRPDVGQDSADVLRTLPDIEVILYILAEEARRGLEGIYSISHELSDLIVVYRRIREIMNKERKGMELTKEEKEIYDSKSITFVAKALISEILSS